MTSQKHATLSDAELKRRALAIVKRYHNNPGLLFTEATTSELDTYMTYVARGANKLQRKTAGLK